MSSTWCLGDKAAAARCGFGVASKRSSATSKPSLPFLACLGCPRRSALSWSVLAGGMGRDYWHPPSSCCDGGFLHLYRRDLSCVGSYGISGANTHPRAPPPVRRPDPEIWRHVSRLELFQAACLLADIEPDFTIVDKPGDANGWLTVLRDALRSDEIKYIKTVYDSQHVLADGYHPHKETVISRESLQQFAAKRHHRKAFLTD